MLTSYEISTMTVKKAFFLFIFLWKGWKMTKGTKYNLKIQVLEMKTHLALLSQHFNLLSTCSLLSTRAAWKILVLQKSKENIKKSLRGLIKGATISMQNLTKNRGGISLSYAREYISIKTEMWGSLSKQRHGHFFMSKERKIRLSSLQSPHRGGLLFYKELRDLLLCRRSGHSYGLLNYS